MSFAFTCAYIGPFCVSHGRGKREEIQRFRFATQAESMRHLGYTPMVMDGRVRVAWSTTPDRPGIEMGVGGSFLYDQFDRPAPAVNEEMTITALTDCSYLCVVASGIQQRVQLERHELAARGQVTVDRFCLVAIAGADSSVRINGSSPKTGIRVVYARSADLVIEADSRCVIGVFSLCN